MNRLVPWLPNVCIFFYTRVRGCLCEHSAPLRCLARRAYLPHKNDLRRAEGHRRSNQRADIMSLLQVVHHHQTLRQRLHWQGIHTITMTIRKNERAGRAGVREAKCGLPVRTATTQDMRERESHTRSLSLSLVVARCLSLARISSLPLAIISLLAIECIWTTTILDLVAVEYRCTFDLI